MDDLRLILENVTGTLKWKDQQKRLLFNWLFRATEKIYITFSTKKPKRSKAQNSLLWIYYKILIDMGYGNYSTTTGLHNWFKKQYAKDKPEYWDNGECILETKEFGVGEFVVYMKWLSELTEVPIPDTSWTEQAIGEVEWKEIQRKQAAFYKALAEVLID